MLRLTQEGIIAREDFIGEASVLIVFPLKCGDLWSPVFPDLVRFRDPHPVRPVFIRVLSKFRIIQEILRRGVGRVDREGGQSAPVIVIIVINDAVRFNRE